MSEITAIVRGDLPSLDEAFEAEVTAAIKARFAGARVGIDMTADDLSRLIYELLEARGARAN